VTKRGRTGGNLITDKGGGRAKAVLSSTEGWSTIQTERPHWQSTPSQSSVLLCTMRCYAASKFSVEYNI